MIWLSRRLNKSTNASFALSLRVPYAPPREKSVALNWPFLSNCFPWYTPRPCFGEWFPELRGASGGEKLLFELGEKSVSTWQTRYSHSAYALSVQLTSSKSMYVWNANVHKHAYLKYTYRNAILHFNVPTGDFLCAVLGHLRQGRGCVWAPAWVWAWAWGQVWMQAWVRAWGWGWGQWSGWGLKSGGGYIFLMKHIQHKPNHQIEKENLQHHTTQSNRVKIETCVPLI